MTTLKKDKQSLTAEMKTKASLIEAFGLSNKELDGIATLAVALCNEDRLEAAVRIFHGLTCLQPDRAEYWSALGGVLTRMEKYQQSIPVLTVALHLNSKDISALVNRAEGYIAITENEKAANDLRAAMELDPQEKDPASNRARQLAYGMSVFFEECQKEQLDTLIIDES
jgi:Flp pilus assembly protein TadD